jgi:hypothetical protein
VDLTVRGSGDATLTTNAGVFAGNAPAATVSVDGSVRVEWTAPGDADGTTALITLTSEEESAASCEVEIGAGGSDDEATRRPDSFPGDGTDLSLGRDEEPELADLEPTRVPTATTEVVRGGPLDDGTGIREGPLVATPVVASPDARTRTIPRARRRPPSRPRRRPRRTPFPPLSLRRRATAGSMRWSSDPRAGGFRPRSAPWCRSPPGASDDRMNVTVQQIPDDELPIGSTVDLVPDSGVAVTLARSDGR